MTAPIREVRPPSRAPWRRGPAAAVLVLALAAAVAAPPAFAQVLTKITGVDPVLTAQSSRSVNWVDTDGDGDLDLYVTNGGSLHENNEYYRNDGGSFVAQPGTALANDSLRADGSSWGDYDGDGDPDCFVVSWYGELNGMFRNEGGGGFTRILTGLPATTGTYSEGCSWVDYDADGDLDLYVASSGNGTPGTEDNLLYRNDGGSFSEVTGEPLVGGGMTTRQASWADYDNDGDVDVFLSNEAGENNRLFRNLKTETGTATFEDLSLPPVTTDGGESWSGSWGDFDNDGDLDLVVANWKGEKNFLYRNELVETGSATFTSILDQRPAQNTGFCTSSAWADWDNDGDLDLVLTNGSAALPTKRQRNFFYRNDGGVLNRDQTSVAASDTAWSYGAAWGDYDGDGDLDLAVANWFGTGEANFLYRNEAQANGNHWLRIRCTGVDSNRSGIGCRITVTAIIGGNPVTQVREITGSDGYCSQTLEAHFGLAEATQAETVAVRWPSGAVQTLTDVAADRLLEIVEATPTGALETPRGGPAFVRLGTPAPNPFRGTTSLEWALTRAGRPRLLVVDATGRRVRGLADGPAPRGVQRAVWDGADDSGRPVAGGVYFVHLLTEKGRGAARKVVLVR